MFKSQVDISMLNMELLKPFNANLWLLSSACQLYTVLNPDAKGASDPCAQSFLHLIKGQCLLLIDNVKMLTYVQKAIPQWLEEVSQGETVFKEVDELECNVSEG